MLYVSTKSYLANNGFSCCFRQWKADSHCKFLHGYAMEVNLEFEATSLDARNWVVDFGSLKSFKGWLEDTFDHKCLVAKDDPHMEWFIKGSELGTIDMILVDNTGCEAFAELLYQCIHVWLKDNGYAPRVRCRKVQVREHSGNFAYVEGPKLVMQVPR